MPNFNLLSPEVNVSNIKGPGSKPIVIAQTAWRQLAQDLTLMTEQWVAQISATEELYKGKAASQFLDAAGRYGDWLAGHARTAGATAESLGQAARAYDTAVESMVPTSTIVANRAAALTMKSTNLLGQFTAKIGELDRAYQHMWAQNADAMNTYQFVAFDIMRQVEEDIRITPAPQVVEGSSSRSFGGYHTISTTSRFDQEEKFS
ncbi:PPE family protein [Mycobacterium haemophilum]|nr:PPE family protein [Mycobacterium haemophilum]